MSVDPVSLGLTAGIVDSFVAYQRTIFFSKADGAYPVGMLNFHIDEHKEPIRTIFQKKLSVDVTSVEELTRRTLHYVYLVKTEGESYIIRINACSEFYWELQFLIEEWLLTDLGKKQIDTVTVKVVDVSRQIVPFDYEIVQLAPGASIFDHSRLGTLTIDMFALFGEYVAKIHEIETQNYGPLLLTGIWDGKIIGIGDSWTDYMSLNISKHLESSVMAEIMSEEEAKDCEHVLEAIKKFTCEKPVLLHGDLANHNAFTDGKKITSLIDWEDSISGDPIYDIAYYGTGCFRHPEWFSAFLDAYKRKRDLPHDFDEKFWVYYLRISIAKALVRERFKDAGGAHLPHVRERLLHALTRAKEHTI